MSMDDAEHDNRVRDDSKEDAVGKTMNDRSSLVAVDSWEALGPGEHFGNDQIHFQSKLQPESRPLFVEPLLRLKQLRSCLRPNDQPRGHDRFKSFRRTSSQGMAVLGSA